MTTLEKALKHYGVDAQILKLCEECSELITAIAHCREKRDKASHVAEEIADVSIMLEQMRIAFGIGANEVNRWIEDKLERLEERIASDT